MIKVAIDDGLAQMKLVSKDETGFTYKKIHTGIRSAAAGKMMDLSGNMIGLYRTEEGGEFVCIENAPTEETRFPDFHVSEIDRVLIHNSLIEAGYGGMDVELLTSLPVDEYLLDGSINKERIERKRLNLMKAVYPQSAGDVKPARIVDVKVGCQAIAAFFDLVLDDTGNLIGDVPSSLAVIDIGGSTTDIAVIMDGKTIDNNLSGACRLGVLDVHTALLKKMNSALKTPLNMSRQQIDAVCKTGSIKLFGRETDISAYRGEAIHEVGSQIKREIERRIGNGAMIEQIVFVGGGAGLFADEVMSSWTHATVPDMAEFANARGLLKYALSKE